MLLLNLFNLLAHDGLSQLGHLLSRTEVCSIYCSLQYSLVHLHLDVIDTSQ
jgi:hypothetical protein